MARLAGLCAVLRACDIPSVVDDDAGSDERSSTLLQSMQCVFHASEPVGISVLTVGCVILQTRVGVTPVVARRAVTRAVTADDEDAEHGRELVTHVLGPAVD
jgi:hypothetical protein